MCAQVCAFVSVCVRDLFALYRIVSPCVLMCFAVSRHVALRTYVVLLTDSSASASGLLTVLCLMSPMIHIFSENVVYMYK
jgi:hypothetical protein